MENRSMEAENMKVESTQERFTFESGMEELERLTRALEAGEMTLEESFAAYERASQLKRALEKLLDAGDARIRVLTESGEEELEEEPR